MAIDKADVWSNAHAILMALERMTPGQKEQAPTAHFGREFNKLLALAKDANPAANARLWPDPVEVDEVVGRQVLTQARYVEIEAYIRQIVSVLDYDDPFGPSMA